MEALKLRRTGITYREVGEKMGVGMDRARKLCKEAEYLESRPARALSTRAANILVNWNLYPHGSEPDPKAVREFIEMKGNDIFKYRNLGPSTVKELCEFSGAQLPPKIDKQRCKCCGQVIRKAHK
ncbi:MAG: hypothetical protein V3V05_10985 [Pontiella sp.]